MEPSKNRLSTLTGSELKEHLRADLKEAIHISDADQKSHQLKEIAKVAIHAREWEIAMEAIKYLPNEMERNLLIADLIESHLLPAHLVPYANECAKFLVPEHESTTLTYMKIALAEKDPDWALELVNELPSPHARNYALSHIALYCFDEGMYDKGIEIGKVMVENARLIADPEHQSYALRDIAKNLFYAHHETELAQETASHIPNMTIRNRCIEIFQ